ncbi:Non-canonical purine NTP pyrophosphatase [Kingella potus]|uniref:dITP/XTP pyrophosphatase n=1 Tax=Kingella potus TaxID=265175 RepID=A0A377R0B9_9NEIS|nr:non-canonical purine NTP pyrophosphatase [Kingella potus]STR00953.1 Non-canonical purine NTP pyrophosphatase [Kingella potus]
MFEKIVLASGNAGKLEEFSRLFAAHHIRILPQSQFDTPECPEPYHTFVENALAKARHASRHSGLPALADDSGICADALGGAPGVQSARFAGGNPKSDAANNAKLAACLAGKADKSCCYVCVLVLVRHPDDPLPVIAEGIWCGQWQDKPAGSNGFGYDPHFYLPAHGRTAAELDPNTKNTESHRAQALRELIGKISALQAAKAV